MGGGPLERLTALDAAFLEMESPTLHMHVGGLFIFRAPEGEPFLFEQFVRLIRSRLHLVPRYRQRLAYTPLNLANPAWVDDTHFDLAYHVRHAALPRPGTLDQLTEYSARILSRPLDRDRPLWEIYLVEGLDTGGRAIIAKTHHALIDGIAGLDLVQTLFNVSPDAPAELPAPEPWTPTPPPSGYDLAASAVRELVGRPGEVVASVRRAIDEPGQWVKRTVEVGQGVLSFARASVSHLAPRTVINQHPGISRRFGVHKIALADVKAVKNAFGTTVNDVVLTIVADMAGRYLRQRGERTRGLELRAMVPFSVRGEDEAHDLGNKVTATFVALPVDEMDPVDRLQVVHDRMDALKGTHSPVGADFLLDLSHFAPPTLHTLGARALASARLFNFVVTNVPGPQFPIYCLGARLEAGYPFVPLAATQSLSVGVTSIDGWMDFGFAADYDAIPDVDRLGDHLQGALADLQRSAEAAVAQRARVAGK
jgi:diacylglycerol O-acyltransferase / wax synthase